MLSRTTAMEVYNRGGRRNLSSLLWQAYCLNLKFT